MMRFIIVLVIGVVIIVAERMLRIGDLQLTENFKLSEFVRTSYNVVNRPGVDEMEGLYQLSNYVLQPWRDKVGPLRVTSGYRSRELQALIGGLIQEAEPDHSDGLAADVVPVNMSVKEAFEILVKSNIPFYKAILEEKNGLEWIHVEFSPDHIGKAPQIALKAIYSDEAKKMQYFPYG